MTNEDQHSQAPGWSAIDGALARLYPGVEPLHHAPPLPAVAGGNDPLDGISVYRSTLGGQEHWHFISYGFSELFAKESDDPENSGFGFEMTMRVVDPEHTDEPPAWPISLLQNLARYVFHTGNAFAVGHHSTLNGPIALGRTTALVAAAFAADPALPAIDTPHGRVAFVQLVGLTQDEYDAMRAWDTERMLALFAEQDPALLTDLARASRLEDDALKTRAEEGIARDGSSTAALFSAKGELARDGERTVIGVAANTLPDLQRAMRTRLAHGRDLTLVWPDGALNLRPGDATFAEDDDSLVLAPADQEAIVALPVQRGDHPLPSGRVVIKIIPIEILDGARQRVERVVG